MATSSLQTILLPSIQENAAALDQQLIRSLNDELVCLRKCHEALEDRTKKFFENLIRVSDLITKIDFPPKKKKQLFHEISHGFFKKDVSWLYRNLAVGKFLSERPGLIDAADKDKLLKLLFASKLQRLKIADEIFRSEGIATSPLLTSSRTVKKDQTSIVVLPTTPTPENTVSTGTNQSFPHSADNDDANTIDGSTLIRESDTQTNSAVTKEIEELKAQLQKEKEINRMKDEALSRMTLEVAQLRNFQSAIQSQNIGKTEKPKSLNERHTITGLRDEVRRMVNILQKMSANPKRNKSTISDKDVNEMLVEMATLLDSLDRVVRR